MTVRRWRSLVSRWWVLVLVVFCAGRPVPALEIDPPGAVPGEVLLALPAGGDDTALRAALAAGLGSAAGFEPVLGIGRIKLRAGVGIAEALAFLRHLPGVRFVEPNHRVEALAVPDDPYYSGEQYGPQRVQADRAWEIWRPQAPVVIAILDSGVDSTHPDLTHKIYRDAGGIVGYDAFAQQRSDALDDFWHGTHCAGVAAAQIANGVGIAGIAGWNSRSGASDTSFIRIMPVKVLDADGGGTAFSIAGGIRWAADHGARVISMSLGSPTYSSTLASAVNYALGKGCVVVASAGNSGTSSSIYPAAYSGVISVAATDETDTLTFYSTYGSWVTVAAPGESILSTTPTYSTRRGIGLNYRTASGTSMACPHVAGQAALILSQNPALSPGQVRDLIATNVDPYTPYDGRALAAGAGRINIFRALQKAGGLPSLTGLTVSPTSARGGSGATGRVTLSGPAPPAGLVVALSSGDTAVAAVPESVTVSGGATSASFPVTTSPVAATTSVLLSAAYDGFTRSATLKVVPDPYTPASISLSPTTVTGGRSVRGTVTLSLAAPPGGIVVSLSSSDTAAATLPASVTIPAGSSSASFTVTTRAVADPASVVVTASRAGVSQTVELTLNPAVLSYLARSSSTVTGGASSRGTVYLNGPAPAGGAEVTLESARPEVVSVPPTVTVPAGARSASFTITTQPVVSTTSPVGVRVTATYRGVTKSVTQYVRTTAP